MASGGGSIDDIDIGDVVVVACQFEDCDGNAVDPSVVTLMYKNSNGTTTVVYDGVDGIERVGIGTYQYELDVDVVDLWHYRWEGSGTVIAADEGSFRVSESAF